MSKGKKVAFILMMGLFVLVTGLAIIIPMLIDVDRYRSQVAAHIEQETGKPTQIGHLALSILPQVAIRVDDFALGNPQGFPTGDFVKSKKIYAVVDLFALLNHKVVINSLELDSPTIHLFSDVRGKWNYQSPPSKTTAAADPPGDDKASFTLGVISKVTIKNGEFAAGNLLASGAPEPAFVEVHGATINLQQVDLNAFTTAALRRPAPGRMAALTGGLIPVVYADESKIPMVAQGTLQMDTVQFGSLAVTKFKSKLRLYPKQVFLDDLDMTCYGGKVTGDLSLNFAGKNLGYATNTHLKGVNVAQFLNAFPQARGMMTGTLEGTAKVEGEVTHSPDPLAGIRGTGQMSIRDGRLPSLQLNANLRTLAKLANLGPANGDPSSFSSVSVDFKIAEQRLSTSKITVVGNGMSVDGSGSMTMAGDGSLDYQGVAGIATSGNNPLANVVAGLSGATVSGGKLNFPFTVGGTFASPKFSLKGGATGVGAVSQAVAAQPVNTVLGIAGMLKKKKTQQ